MHFCACTHAHNYTLSIQIYSLDGDIEKLETTNAQLQEKLDKILVEIERLVGSHFFCYFELFLNLSILTVCVSYGVCVCSQI